MEPNLKAWIAAEDWHLCWRILMNNIGVCREGDHPYCLTPWF